MKKLLLVLLLTGCTKWKCVDGYIWEYKNGIWVENYEYREFKCSQKSPTPEGEKETE